MKSQITCILKILAALSIMILLSGCMITMPKVRSGNAEIGFDVFSNNSARTSMNSKEFNSPTSLGIRYNY
jgi:LEA14-like dessication related protein